MKQLHQRVAIVTGASQGIGRGIARLFAAEGARLILNSRNAAVLDRLADDLAGDRPGDIECVAGDVAQEEVAERLVQRAVDRFGRVDLLINNAGVFDGGPLDEFSTAAWDRVIATNLRAPFLCTRAAMRVMKRQQCGRIINIGSISAQRVRHHSAAYSTSKHGLWGLTQVTALEGRAHGITCGCLQPGNIKTERRTDSGKPEDAEPMLSVDEIAQVALLMAALPPHVEMLEAIVLPHQQAYVGRG